MVTMTLDEHVQKIMGVLTFQLAQFAAEIDQLREKLVALDAHIVALEAVRPKHVEDDGA